MLFHLFNQYMCVNANYPAEIHVIVLFFLRPYGIIDYERNRTMQHAMSYIIWHSIVALFVSGTYYTSFSAFTAISSLPALESIKQSKKKKRLTTCAGPKPNTPRHRFPTLSKYLQYAV